MSCCEIAPGVHVCRVDGAEVKVSTRRHRWWCFKCRQHTLHERWRFDPVQPSYYGPHWTYKCEGCHEDHRTFPGF